MLSGKPIIDKLQLDTDLEIETAKLIERFNLQLHPEGGYYARFFKSSSTVKPTDKIRYNNEDRSAGTSIYYLLKANDFSAWHRLKSDEIWHFYKGSPIKIHIINKQGTLSTHLLGDNITNPEASFQIAITAGDWFAAELIDKSSYSFVGCTVTPGFDFQDFELADRIALTNHFPKHSSIISRLTRSKKPEISLSTGTRIYSKL